MKGLHGVIIELGIDAATSKNCDRTTHLLDLCWDLRRRQHSPRHQGLPHRKERGFKIIVLLPPAANALMPKIEHVRTVISMQSMRLGIAHYDLEFWDESMTKDGIHPGPELSRFIAYFVYSLLEPGMHTGSLEVETECNPTEALQGIG